MAEFCDGCQRQCVVVKSMGPGAGTSWGYDVIAFCPECLTRLCAQPTPCPDCGGTSACACWYAPPDDQADESADVMCP